MMIRDRDQVIEVGTGVRLWKLNVQIYYAGSRHSVFMSY